MASGRVSPEVHRGAGQYTRQSPGATAIYSHCVFFAPATAL